MKRAFLFLTLSLFLLGSVHAGVEAMEGTLRSKTEDFRLIDPQAASVTLNHGHRTPTVYVLLHGLSNCPTQFRKFGELLYRSGANVVIPRLPYHGYRDRMTDAQKNLTAAAMIANAEAALAHAHTLGRKVTVIGLSAGGVTAAWVAQNRADVEEVLLIAPFFSIGFLPDWLTVPSRDLFSVLPNAFIWWDPRQGRNLKGSPFAYPRFSTRAVGQLMRLGTQVFDQARHAAPKAKRIEIVTNPADLAVNNARTASLVRLWEARAPNRVTTFTLPAEWDAPHDLIDPWNPDQQVDRIYPILLNQLGIKN